MKQLIVPPLRKLRFLAIIPVIALIMYAFAEPAYIYVSVTEAEAHLPETDTRDSARISPPETDTIDTGRSIVPAVAESILYVIDGEIAEIFSPYMLKPSDIISISVIRRPEAIKDHSKIYNYSIEGITSVILIETKKGD